jgi:hypothetical protein
VFRRRPCSARGWLEALVLWLGINAIPDAHDTALFPAITKRPRIPVILPVSGHSIIGVVN